MKTYIFVYLGSAFLALVITPILIKLAIKVKAVDRPGIRTVHTRAMPRIGGVAIFLSVMPLSVTMLYLNNAIGDTFRNIQLQLVVLFGSATIVFLIGLIDDFRGLPARFKLLAELFAACALCIAGVRITSIGITDGWILHLGLLSYPLTLLWIVGITNAVNLSDGLDGLAAGISAVACAVIAIFAVYGNQVVMAVLMIALFGSLSGFLFFNFNPARIFMGDCGSLFLGFTLASSSVLCSMKSPALVGLALPLLALGIPIFDMLFCILRRFLERRSLFSPDRSHFHHRLLDLGLRQRHVVISIYAMTLFSAGMGMFMMITRNAGSLVVFLCILLMLLLLFHLVGSVRPSEIVVGLRKKYAIGQRQLRDRMNFDQAQLRFRNSHTYEEWWQAACDAAQQMDFAWLSLKTLDEYGTVQTEMWRPIDNQLNSSTKSMTTGRAKPTKWMVDKSSIVTINVPVRNNSLAGVMEFEIVIWANDSIESATHRATLFGRLIDEHDIAPVSM